MDFQSFLIYFLYKQEVCTFPVISGHFTFLSTVVIGFFYYKL